MKNEKIRQAAMITRVKLWEVAAALGVTDGTLSRKLRFELPEDEQEKIVCIIEQIAAERDGANG